MDVQPSMHGCPFRMGRYRWDWMERSCGRVGVQKATRPATCSRSLPEEVPPESKCFAFVQGYDTKPKRRLFELLCSQGMQANQQVTFFSDGGDTVRRLPEYLKANAEHILDWFHLTMKLTVLQQCASGLAPEGDVDQNERGLERRLESVKQYLWHGNTASARSHLQEIDEWLEGWLDDDDGNRRAYPDSDKITRMRKYLHE